MPNAIVDALTTRAARFRWRSAALRKPYVSVLVRTRCCHAVPARTPTTAGSPTRRRVADLDLAPEREDDHPRARGDGDREQDVAVAARSGIPTTRISSGTAMMPPPTPKRRRRTPPRARWRRGARDVSYEHGQPGRPLSRSCSQPESLFRALPPARRRPAPRCSSSQHDPRLCPSPLWRLLGRRWPTACGRVAGTGSSRRAATPRAPSTATAGHMPTRFPQGSLVRGGDRARRRVRRPHARPASRVTPSTLRQARPRSAAATTESSTTASAASVPCFSYRAGQVNGSSRVMISECRPPGVGRAGAERSSARSRATDEGRASTHAAGSRTTPDGAASSARCVCTPERRSLAPEDIPGEPHVVLARPEAADSEPELIAVGEARVREEDLTRVVDALEQPLVVLVRALAPEADEREVPRRRHLPAGLVADPALRTAPRGGRAREVAAAARCARSSGGRPTASAPGIAGRAGSRPRSG